MYTAIRNPRKPTLAQGGDGHRDSAHDAGTSFRRTATGASGRGDVCCSSAQVCALSLNTSVTLSKSRLCLSEFMLSRSIPVVLEK